MEVGMIGLGRMGANMTERMARSGHRVVVFDRDAQAVERASNTNVIGATSIADLVSQLNIPRAVWVMIPAGEPVEQTVQTLSRLLTREDILIDGGNSNFRDSQRRAGLLERQGIRFVDVGTSGGIWGLTEGYCLMIGGDENAVQSLRPLFESLAPAADRGWGRVGPAGAGHFVKMVHNGIEYGLMQAYAEGFALMEKRSDLELNLHQVAETWRHGSVVRSWLLDLTAEALASNPDLKGIQPFVNDSGEGRWAVEEAVAANVAMPIITMSLLQRIQSRDSEGFAHRMLAVMRNKFGGHDLKTE